MTVKVKARIEYYESLKNLSEKKEEKNIRHFRSNSKNERVDIETIDKVDEHAKEIISEYNVYYREDTNKTYIIYTKAIEINPSVSEVIQKSKRIFQQQKIRPDERRKKIDDMFNGITKKLFLKEGRLMKPYSESGIIKHYDTGMTPKSLAALLEQACLVEDVETKVFHLIGEEHGIKGKFLSIPQNKNYFENRCVIHIGEKIGGGAAGKVYKVWHLNNNRVLVLKQSFSQDEEKVLERTTSLDIEADHLKKINPRGKYNGVQRAPYLVFRISARSSSFVGLVSVRYDSDLWAILSPVDLEGFENKNRKHLNLEQLIDGAQQIFSGISHLNRSKVLNADIKSSNIFVKQRSKGNLKFDISDFDQVVCLNDNLYRSEEFARNPLGGFSSDSLKLNHQRWAEETANAIVLRQQAHQMPSDQKKEFKKMFKKKKVHSKEEKEKFAIYKTKKKTLKTQITALKESFEKIALDIHTISAGHILFQMLSSEVNLNIDEIDFNRLEGREDFSGRERDLYIQLANLCVRCLPQIEKAPDIVNLKNLYPPMDISADEYLKIIEGISRDFRDGLAK